MKKQQEEIQVLAQDRVPNGMKPVPYPYETAFLDSLMINRGEWKVELPENTNLREARKMIHCSYLRIMREIDHEIAKAQRVELRNSTKNQHSSKSVPQHTPQKHPYGKTWTLTLKMNQRPTTSPRRFYESRHPMSMTKPSTTLPPSFRKGRTKKRPSR